MPSLSCLEQHIQRPRTFLSLIVSTFVVIVILYQNMHLSIGLRQRQSRDLARMGASLRPTIECDAAASVFGSGMHLDAI